MQNCWYATISSYWKVCIMFERLIHTLLEAWDSLTITSKTWYFPHETIHNTALNGYGGEKFRIWDALFQEMLQACEISDFQFLLLLKIAPFSAYLDFSALFQPFLGVFRFFYLCSLTGLMLVFRENFWNLEGYFVFLYMKTHNKLWENWSASQEINIYPALLESKEQHKTEG